MPSHVPISLIRYFSLPSALLYLLPYHMHPLPRRIPSPITSDQNKNRKQLIAKTVQTRLLLNLAKKCKGPSIYDVHTEGGGDQAQVDACGRGRGVQPHVDIHTEN